MKFVLLCILSVFFCSCSGIRITYKDGKVSISTEETTEKVSTAYSPTNPNQSMIQFNANTHSYGKLP
jgi:hypothetical protein